MIHIKSAAWLTLIAIGAATACNQRAPDAARMTGRIEFADGSTQSFREMLELAFQPSDSSGLVKWPIEYSPTLSARSIPLAWVESLEVLGYQPDDQCQCMRDVSIAIRTVTGVEFKTSAMTLEWLRIRPTDDDNRDQEEREVRFAGPEALAVRRLVFVE